MKINKIYKKLKKLHRWPALIAAIILVLFSISGILLNHRDLISPFTLEREYLPTKYHYSNWNLASIKDGISLTKNRKIIFGNIGLLETTDNFKTFKNFNQGLPTGVDGKKVNDLILTSKNILLAATNSGIYKRVSTKMRWKKLHFKENRFKNFETIFEKDGLITAAHRHGIIQFLLSSIENSSPLKAQKINLLPPNSILENLSLFKMIWFLHSGEIFGHFGKYVVDFLSITMIFLTITGLFFFFFPTKFIKLFQLKPKFRLLSKKYHLRVGAPLALFLSFLALTGMFLRPPLLIPIANIEIQRPDNTKLGKNNIFYNQVRGLKYDQKLDQYFLFFSGGKIFTSSSLKEQFQPLILPPISVMGLTVFKRYDKNYFLIGSFSGLYLWNPETGSIFDFFTRSPPKTERRGNPTSAHLISGLIIDNNNEYFIFDYSYGLQNLSQSEFGIMKKEVKLPISLWSLSLEVHTARIFEPLFGIFYMLIIPFLGLGTIFVLFTGGLMWLISSGRKKKKKQYNPLSLSEENI